MSSEIKTLQINVNRSLTTTEHVLQLAIELNISILAIQEPWTTTGNSDGFRTVNHSSFKQVLPNYGSLRPRVVFYVSDVLSTSIAPSSPQDPDCVIIDLAEHSIQLINVYNATHPESPNRIKTLQREGLLQDSLPSKTILLGDFNIHHPWWDPLSPQSSASETSSLLDLVEKHAFSLLNTPGEGTFYRPNMEAPSVLDLTFATQGIVNQIEDWQVLPDLGSDHSGVLFTIFNSISTSPLKSLRFNTKKADWKRFRKNLIQSFSDFNFDINSKYSNRELDQIGELFTSNITQAAIDSIPRAYKSATSKPWWNEDLKFLRKSMQKYYRLNKASGYTLFFEELKTAKNLYFNTIKRKKREHWNQFLEREDAQSIFKAMAYTKNSTSSLIPSLYNSETNVLQSTFQEKCHIFRNTLFPAPPITPPIDLTSYIGDNSWKWPLLSKVELRDSCTSKIKGKTPGPDLITQEIIVRAYTAIPEVFYIVYSILVNQGYHPKCWKKATGFILKKPQKPDYSKPKAYRVISLLNCLGKVSERILARRLSHLAETTTLLHDSQIGSRLKKSAIDAALLLQNEVEINKANKLKTTTLFLDVKGAFDHVSKNRLIKVLTELRLPLSLISWISSFLEHRLLQLTFDNKSEEFQEISTGIPQGSPISPILFLIYIRDLFKSKNIKPLSYMDDIALIASSKSYKQNIITLERETQLLVELGKEHSISFDIEKTELIHFFGGKNTPCITLPNNAILAPSKLVKWLGIHFDSNLKFKNHRSIRTSLAKQMFYRVIRLANITHGLSSFALRQLYIACVTSVADYGSILWWKINCPNKATIRPFEALQNLATKKILGVFKTAPNIPSELEAALPPPHIRLNHASRRYIHRALQLSSKHPIRHEVGRAITEADEIVELVEALPKADTTISSLVNSIYPLFDFESLERIRPFYFPPWEREVPFSVEISKLPKEDEAKAHLQYLQSICNSRNTSIYTDGSQTLEGRGVGFGFAVYTHIRDHIPLIPIHSKRGNIGDSELVYNGELEAVTQAIEYASSIAKEGESYTVYTDNQAALLRLKTPSDNPGQSQQIRAILAAKTIKARKARIKLAWVPGHSDIVGNEEADSLAKAATKVTPDSNYTSFACLGVILNSQKRSETTAYIARNLKTKSLQTHSSKYTCQVTQKLRLPSGTKRETGSSFYQLKLGHGYLKSYLYKLGLASTNKCRCGSIETAIHLLLNCKVYKTQRQGLITAVKKSLQIKTITPSILLHTQIGIRETLVFLKETRICTRNWHLERGEYEEVEEEENSAFRP